MTEPVQVETKAPKRERTPAQKAATENMLMKLRAKREQAEAIIAADKEKKAGRPKGTTVEAGAKKATHQVNKQPQEPTPAPAPAAAAGGIDYAAKGSLSNPAGGIDYDELARRVAAISLEKPKRARAKERKRNVVIEESSSESESYDEQPVRRGRTMTRSDEKAIRQRAHEPPMAPIPNQPAFQSSGSRVLDAMLYGRRNF